MQATSMQTVEKCSQSDHFMCNGEYNLLVVRKRGKYGGWRFPVLLSIFMQKVDITFVIIC